MKKKKSLSVDEVKHLAKLANLSLTQEELEKFSKQLSSILDYVDQLSEVNTDKVDSTSNVTGLSNVFREDLSIEGHKIKNFENLALIKKGKDSYFKVNRIMQ